MRFLKGIHAVMQRRLMWDEADAAGAQVGEVPLDDTQI